MKTFRRCALATAAVLISGLVVTPAVASPPANETTLITGDRVQVVARQGKPPNVVVKPAPGRERMPFLKTVDEGKVSVIPFDAQQLVINGVLDAKLFDVTKPTSKVIIRHSDEQLTSVKLTGSLWHQINPDAPNQTGELPGISKISPDRILKPLDHDSVRQIKAPRAWQRGLTAKGVKVAVLDTGVDQDHPDLKGRIKATKDFTEQDDVTDERGHGTHVAGIIAGSGPEPGTAPEADLLIGKVCGPYSCEESAVIEGMRWAAEQGAKVVNLSLGGDTTDGTDELSLELNSLSAKYNTLFVVAAGNEGGAESVSTPAAADAALAVASVTKDNQLSYFSSRGPRTDGAVKPEISAPGHAIAAARARGTSMGYPINDRHTLASGTSMAAPHVTGAAAILAGQHPDWSPARLKAALTGTADPINATVFEQGTGIVNVDRATKTQLTAEPATLKLGTGTITYRNDSSAKIKLSLSLPGNVKADRTTIEVPARSTATATFTATKPGAGGVITARDNNNVIRTAVSTQSNTQAVGQIKVQSIDRQSSPNGTGGYGFLVAMANHDNKKLYAGGIANGRALQGEIPQGRYTIYTWVPSPIDGRPPWEPSQTLVTKDVTVGQDGAEVTLDARQGQRLQGTVNGAGGTGLVGTSLGTPNGSAFASQGDEVYVVPGSAQGMIYTAVQYLRNVPGSANCSGTTTPCAIALSKENAVTPTLPKPADADFAKVTAKIGAPTATGDWVTFTEHPLSTPPPGDAAGDIRFPGTHTTYYHSAGDLEWWSAQVVDQQVLQAQTWRKYANGQAYEEKWSQSVRGPAVTSTRHQRTGNMITANIALLSDSTPGHYGIAGDQGLEGHTELHRNGKLVDGLTHPDGGVFQVPPGKARYRLEAATDRVRTAWEFDSEEGTGPLPLTAVRFEARDGGNLPFRLDKTATAGRTKKLTVDVSYDDGKTWERGSYVLLGDRGVLLSVKSGPVSLRTRVMDVYGNSGAQTIIRALT
ncbi:S8 family serine peptidase [Lentzea sp. PSKA42]|uniref:S8 family serine peptidase n=1 Tax=Lentzea indica TaxID=2604800 RepID=A0ABX1FFF1_9PSEU|nr:S8 family serine peptidase [Lentzea indica]NKE57376.1 S8 family serine peptidase [Lentzea indica]